MATATPLPASRVPLEQLERSQLIDRYRYYRRLHDEKIRRLVLEDDRIDILAEVVLGYEVQPFHLAMLQFQFRHAKTLQLVFRGAGKTTLLTIAKAIHLLLKNPNLRILISSKTTTNAEAFLKEIKGHFEQNEALARIFGPYYDAKKCKKWDNREIEVLPRTSTAKEGSITCVGVDGTIVSKHYDVILSDDLVDENNSRTVHMRDKTETWYHKTLDPVLEPPDEKVPHRGEHHHMGTRYHYDDLYGKLMAKALKGMFKIIKPYDEQGRTVWAKYTYAWFMEKMENAGIIIFNSQYLNDVEAMKGEIFEYDQCQRIGHDELPAGLEIYLGADLAIGLKKKENDRFALVVIGVLRTVKPNHIYVLDCFTGNIKFSAQTEKILEFVDRWDPARTAIESNAYQAAQYQTVKETDAGKEVNFIPVQTQEDKVTRAWRFQPKFQNLQMFFLTGTGTVIDQLVGFPNHRYKDYFDGLDLAVIAATRKKKKGRKRRAEPGVL